MNFLLRNTYIKLTAKVNYINTRNSSLKEALKCKIVEQREIVKEFRKQHGKVKIDEVTVDKVYGGMRGLKALVWETTHVDPNEGIKFRGYSIPDLRQKLPKAPCGEEPLPEGILWLLLTGNIPTQEQVEELSKDLIKRANVPDFILNFLKQLPKEVHPMAQLSAASALMSTCSKFAKAYSAGIKKMDYWEPTLEDSLNLIAILPIIAGCIYQNTYKGSVELPPLDPNKDWSYNTSKMLGFDNDEFVELLRMYLTIHSDHEGGNVSAHATHLVGSALSDAYLSYSAGMNGLAGPLHGLANQGVLKWLEKVVKELGESPSSNDLKSFCEKTLKSGQVIPGYGHAVLRKTDPRYICLQEFSKKYSPNDPFSKLAALVYEVVPPILKATGKVQNPWPNVDALSGVLLRYYGMKEMNFYTVMFGVSRAIGVCTALVWSRALLLPIERPISLTTEMLCKMVKKS